MKRPIVIYHGGCSDGVAAAWCFFKIYGSMYEYHPGVFNETPPDVENRTVFLVDFSYDYETMRTICEQANKVVLIDHHKRSLEIAEKVKSEYSNLDTDSSSTEHSGAILAWNYLNGSFMIVPMPKLFKYIEDRDLWSFKLEKTQAVMSAVRSYETDILIYNFLFEKEISELYEEGLVLQRAEKKIIKQLVSGSTVQCSILGYTVPVANAPGIYTSEVGNILCKGYPFAIVYFDFGGEKHISLRSDKQGIDVSEVAAVYGGGGHPHAAGFKLSMKEAKTIL